MSLRLLLPTLMSRLLDLPGELQAAIVDSIDDDYFSLTLQWLSTTHSTLRTLCQRRLFHTVRLYAGTEKMFHADYRRLVPCSRFPAAPRIAAHVRNMTIHLVPYHCDERPVTEALQAVVPNLQVFKVVGTSRRWRGFSEPLSRTLAEAMQGNMLESLCLVNLRRIPAAALYAAMRQVTHLTLRNCSVRKEDRQPVGTACTTVSSLRFLSVASMSRADCLVLVAPAAAKLHQLANLRWFHQFNLSCDLRGHPFFRTLNALETLLFYCTALQSPIYLPSLPNLRTLTLCTGVPTASFALPAALGPTLRSLSASIALTIRCNVSSMPNMPTERTPLLTPDEMKACAIDLDEIKFELALWAQNMRNEVYMAQAGTRFTAALKEGLPERNTKWEVVEHHGEE
uniref:F-box domain-containing protein n=1 Tax=Mycena chlorophos TaxID=658473 RepID=A0ABQ0LSU9_MYCCL|nr:predicted protein [Mycena chlorophos]